MLKKYNGFLLEKFKTNLFLLLESSPIYSSGDFIIKLRNISKQGGNVGDIASAILELIEDGVWLDDKYVRQNYFDVTDKDDMLSFLQSNKIPGDWDEDDDPSLPYTMPGRNEIKLGKIIRLLSSTPDITNFLPFKPTDKDFEDFVNTYKSSKVSSNKDFKIVKGDDIFKYYQSKNYYSDNGSLGGSCMASVNKKVLKIYTDNPKKVRLLVLIDDNGKIHGRALVWKLKVSPCDAKYFMDRVYTNSDSDFYKFRQLAEEKGFLYKEKNNSHIDNNVRFIYKGKPLLGIIKVKLDGDLKEYPFLDTMPFLTKEKNMISNIPSRGCYFVHTVTGECVKCSTCRGNIYSDKLEDNILSAKVNRKSFQYGLCNECGMGIHELVENDNKLTIDFNSSF